APLEQDRQAESADEKSVGPQPRPRKGVGEKSEEDRHADPCGEQIVIGEPGRQGGQEAQRVEPAVVQSLQPSGPRPGVERVRQPVAEIETAEEKERQEERRDGGGPEDQIAQARPRPAARSVERPAGQKRRRDEGRLRTHERRDTGPQRRTPPRPAPLLAQLSARRQEQEE